MPKNKNKLGAETLTGIVTPVQWDQQDQVCAVVLSATDDEEYRIENGEKFFDLVQKRIEAVGKVRRDRKQFRSIIIKRYRVMDEV